MQTTAHTLTDYRAQEAARAATAKAMQAANPHLVAGGDCVTAAKNIRLELKRAFPGTKFSVITSKYSGGNSLRVRWTDGPNDFQVSEITGRYVGASFDGMTDSTTYLRSAWTDAFGSSDYIFRNRDASDAAVVGAVRTLMARYAGNFSALGIATVSVADFRSGALYAVDMMDSGGNQYWSLQALIHRALSRRTYALPKVRA